MARLSKILYHQDDHPLDAKLVPILETYLSLDIEEEDELEQMTKSELEALGREHGIELDRRKNKADLIEELKEVI